MAKGGFLRMSYNIKIKEVLEFVEENDVKIYPTRLL